MNQFVLLYWKFWRNPHYRYAMTVVVILLFTAAVSMAQTDTPVPPPTATAIPNIELPTGDMIASLNQWLTIFSPIILFITMIPVALQLLENIVYLFQKVFSRGGD